MVETEKITTTMLQFLIKLKLSDTWTMDSNEDSAGKKLPEILNFETKY